MKMYTKKVAGNCFTTFQMPPLQATQYIRASHIYIAHQHERELLADDIFQFINSAYDGIGGFKSFKDMNRFINDSYLWYITYDGIQPNDLKDFDIRKVYVVSVFRKNHGMKMVGMARRKILPDENDKKTNQDMRRNANSALMEHIRFTAKIGWAEVSDKLETYFGKALSIYDIIDPYVLKEHKIFRELDVDIDEFHYYRPLCTGEEPVRKIAYGTIKL